MTKLIRNCQSCESEFEAMRSTAKYCGDTCRKAGQRGKASSKVITPKKPRSDRGKVEVCAGSVDGKCPTQKAAPYYPKRQKEYRCIACRKINSLNNHLSNFIRSSTGIAVVRTIIRAGTLETFAGMDDLDAYVKLIRARRLYESTEKKPDFHICHLVPLKTDNVVGLTNSRNCIIGLAEVNQGLGNKAVFTQAEHGKNYLFKEDLAKRWLVNPNDVEKVKKLLPDYFGPELSEWCRRMSFTPRGSGSV